MPTTNNEANKIVEIAKEYMDLEKAKELFKRLYDEVGSKSDNDSVKESLRMMSLLMR